MTDGYQIAWSFGYSKLLSFGEIVTEVRRINEIKVSKDLELIVKEENN